ncbi:hypothetical protein [Ferruginibacter sp.]
MTTMIRLILNNSFTKLFQQFAFNYNAAPLQYSLQPLPSYWQMIPNNKIS